MDRIVKFTALFLPLLLNLVGLFPLFAATVNPDNSKVSSSTSNMVGVDSSYQSEESVNNTDNSSVTAQPSTNPTSPATDAFYLPEVTVYGRGYSGQDISDAAS
ncbi:MAG: hypothetical protein NUV86_13340, partial [Candidatus Scalindua sp.]|nr:hypothetical protein [Candidatus Scalindua sp.]